MSLSALHSKQLFSDGIHCPISFVYLNEQERLQAVDFEYSDGYKFALQLEDQTVWMLLNTTPEWIKLFTSNNVYDTILEQSWLGGLENWTVTVTGGATAYPVQPSIGNVYGVIRLDSGDGYTDFVDFGLNVDGYESQRMNIVLGAEGSFSWEALVKLGPLPTVSRDYTFFAGLNNPDGYGRLGFLMDFSESDGYWCCVAEASQTSTIDVSNFELSDGYWTKLKFDCTNSNTKFYINDIHILNISQNLPINIGMYPSFKIQKVDGPLPAKCDLDWIRLSHVRTNLETYNPILD